MAREEFDVQGIVAAALAGFTDAASPTPMTEALEEEDQRRRSKEAQSAVEQDEELEIVGAKEAREVGPQELGVADKAGPKTGEVETCRHWAKGWCMRADACRFAHPRRWCRGSTPGITPDSPGHGPCGGPQPGPQPGRQPGPRKVAAEIGGKRARRRAPSGGVCGGE